MTTELSPAHGLLMSRPHPQGRAVVCTCRETFVHADSTEALIAWMDHSERMASDDAEPTP